MYEDLIDSANKSKTALENRFLYFSKAYRIVWAYLMFIIMFKG